MTGAQRGQNLAQLMTPWATASPFFSAVRRLGIEKVVLQTGINLCMCQIKLIRREENA